MSSATSRYRRDIDGLRAMAVLPIVLFHAAVPGFAGGFVGVDIFYVISGFLITSIILREGNAGNFSFRRFYERRITRLAPALAVLVAVVLLVSLWMMPPDALQEVARSALATLTFTSNIFFMLLAGSYFDPGADYRPLLHTWSLAIEEQYYLFFPAFLIAILRWMPRWKVAILTIVAMLSLALSIYGAYEYAKPTFYLLPTRAWELLAGSLLAAGAVPVVRARSAREALGAIGLVLVLVPVFIYDDRTPFPGLAAIPPVLGAMLVIHVADGTWTGRVLSARWATFVGAISYSLYLWHWPIIVFIRSYFLTFGPFQMVASIILSFVVGWASWRWVETPFRRPAAGSNAVFGVFAGSTLALAAISGAVLAAQGLPGRGMGLDRNLEAAKAAAQALQTSPCLARGADLPPESCVLGNASAVTAALWGDSHGAHLAPALADLATRQGIGIRQITKAGCPPIAAERFYPRDTMRRSCAAFNQAALRRILDDTAIRTVILAGWWDVLPEGSVMVGQDGTSPTTASSIATVQRVLHREIAALTAAGKRVVLIGQVPVNAFNTIDCYERARFLNHAPTVCERDTGMTQKARDGDAAVVAMLTGAALRSFGLRYISPVDILCRTGTCQTRSAGRHLYMDREHLSPFGAAMIVAPLAGTL